MRNNFNGPIYPSGGPIYPSVVLTAPSPGPIYPGYFEE